MALWSAILPCLADSLHHGQFCSWWCGLVRTLVQVPIFSVSYNIWEGECLNSWFEGLISSKHNSSLRRGRPSLWTRLRGQQFSQTHLHRLLLSYQQCIHLPPISILTTVCCFYSSCSDWGEMEPQWSLICIFLIAEGMNLFPWSYYSFCMV